MTAFHKNQNIRDFELKKFFINDWLENATLLRKIIHDTFLKNSKFYGWRLSSDFTAMKGLWNNDYARDLRDDMNNEIVLQHSTGKDINTGFDVLDHKVLHANNRRDPLHLTAKAGITLVDYFIQYIHKFNMIINYS